MRRLLPATLLLAVLLLPGADALAGPDEPSLSRRALEDIAAITDGVERIAVPGVPGMLSVFGPDAFPVVEARAGGHAVPVVVGARFKRGRFVAFGHNGWFGDLLGKDDTGRLVVNAIRWAAGKAGERRKGPRVAVLDEAPLLRHLVEAGLDASVPGGGDWAKRLKGYDVLFTRLSRLGDADVEALRMFVAKGGGIVSGLPGWGWQQLNAGRDLATDCAGNRLFAPAGFVWGSGLIEVPAGRRLVVEDSPPALLNAGLALDALAARGGKGLKLSKADRALAAASLTRCVNDLPADDEILLPRLERLLRGPAAKDAIPSAKEPLTTASGIGRILLALQIRQARKASVDDVTAHPAAEHFPGAVPRRAKRVTRSITIDAGVPDWHSTGLYAAPGEVVTLEIPAAARGAGFALRIGAHKDRLWGKDTWRRAPEITRTFPAVEKITRGANAFGGPIYVVAPKKCELGGLQVTIGGAVEAPYFVRGETTLEAWRDRVRKHPAPWAELEGNHVILTVPSSVVRDLEDPEALMVFWDRVADACADLAAMPRERRRPERYVTDEQISAGYMHAGYPIMTHLDAAKRFVDLERVSARGDWGMFHEIGHNHQQSDWTFDGTVEVTVNLFTLYVLETVCTAPRMHKALTPESVKRKWDAHRAKGLPFADWKRDPFLALIPYVQMKDAFGWEAFQRVFAVYRALNKNERPKNDREKRDQWLVRFSRAVGRNLGPFFRSWGIPVTDAAVAGLADLPEWMPEDPG